VVSVNVTWRSLKGDSGFEQAIHVRERDRLSAAVDPELREDVLDVRTDGALADDELGRDLRRGEPVGEERQR